MTLTLAYSSEMMTNNLQAELIAPQKKFDALQTADGHSLLFAVGTNGAFNVIQEQSGSTVSGWTVTDLSTARVAHDFPSGGTVSTFEVGQSVADGSYGLAMVVTSGTANQLYLSLGNSSTDLSWTAAPNWTAYPYDNPSITLSSLEIVTVYFCEPTGTTQYIIVDVVRDPTSAVQDVERFFIDPTRKNGHAWNSHDLPIDIEVGSYDSVLGRVPNGYVDGLYTAGQAGDSGQLVYVPIINVFGSGPPLPVRLDLPAAAVPGAVASVRNADLSTDLFVVSGSTLFYFASTNQTDAATPTTLIDNDVLSGTTQLVSVLHDGVVTLWGRNGSDEVYSLSCAQASVTDTSAWSVPLPLLSGIEHISPFVNAVDGGNTIFSAGAGAVERMTRNEANGLWVTDQITLPAPPTQPSITFNSYTTSIQATGDDGLPARSVSVGLAANRRAAVYINGTYYVLGSSPIHVSTTSIGTITIVEAIGTLVGTTFTVSTGTGSGVTINPMDGPIKKLATLDTGDKLSAATITNEDGSTRPLVPSGTNTDDLNAVASGLQQLGNTYPKVSSPGPGRALAAPRPLLAASLGGDDAIAVGIGDLFQWLETGVEAVVKVVEDVANDVAHFIAEIGDAVYTAVIDSVEAVIGAAQWLFNAIKTAIQDIIDFLEFLFGWDDIARTKAVFHNLISQFLTGQVNELQVVKGDIDEAIGNLEQTIDTWAGITDWSPLGDAAGSPAASSASNPMQGQTAASQHLNHHFQNNAGNISIVGDSPAPDLLQSLIDDLFTALSNEGKVLDGVIDQLQQLASDFSSLSVEQVIKRLVGILADAVLSSVQVVIDAILDILTDIAAAALQLLDTKLHIPVISDILNAIGVPDLSFLDLFCWIAAAAYTIVYKIAEGVAPFPDDQTTTFLSTASSIDDLVQAFNTPAAPAPAPSPHPAAMAVAPAVGAEGDAAAAGPIPIPDNVAGAVFRAGHSFAGFFALMSCFVDTFEASELTGDNPFSTPSAVLGVLGGGVGGVTNVLVPRYPIENKYVSYSSTGTTVIRILAKLVFSGPLQSKFGASSGVMKSLAVGDGRATGAIVDAILVIPALACTGWHFYELSQQAASSERSDAILEEVSNLTSDVSRVAYAVAVNDDDPESREIIIGVMAVANVVTGGLQIAEAVVG
jgi:hypothetical protein